MKIKTILSLALSVIISAAVLASCAATPKAPAPQSLDESARVTAAPEDGREADDADGQSPSKSKLQRAQTVC